MNRITIRTLSLQNKKQIPDKTALTLNNFDVNLGSSEMELFSNVTSAKKAAVRRLSL